MGTARTTHLRSTRPGPPHLRSSGRRAALAAVTATALALLMVPGAVADGGPVRVASGLDNPRHLTFAPDGALFVAEAGRGGSGPCQAGPESDEICFGRTGAVTRVTREGVQSRVVRGMPSLADPDGSGATGPQGVAFSGGRLDVAVGLGGNPALRRTLPSAAKDLGTLQQVRLATGSTTKLADLVLRERDNNPVDDVDSNPVSVLQRGGTTLVTDAGANAVVRIAPDGQMSNAAVFPTTRAALAPPFLGLPPGTMIPVQEVPTSTVVGPDGALYVSELTGFPFVQGFARIYRVAPGGQVSVYADGLTNVTDLAFDGDTLYAVQLADEGLLGGDPAAPPSGSLIEVVPGADAVTVVDDLVAPYGVSVRKGAAYVSTCGVCAGGGEVWRYGLD